MVVLTLIVPKNVWGGGNGLRLWTPYTDTQKRRDPNGLYVELEAVYKTISAAPNAAIGYSNPDGNYRVSLANTVVDPREPVDGDGNTQYLAVGTIVNRDASKVLTETSGALGERLVWNGNNTIRQNNTLSTNFIDPSFVAGTRVTVGYVQKHHGWRFIFEGLPSQQQTVTVNGASMVLFDSETVTSYTLTSSQTAYNMALRPSSNDPTKYEWQNQNGSSGIDVTDTTDHSSSFKPMEGVGYLWAWFPTEWSDWEQGKLAAAPITYTYASITSKADHWSTELMYTYRMHPLRCGSFELSAGFRYWELKDTLSFYGSGNTLITDGTKNENVTNQPNEDNNVTGSGSTNTGNTSNTSSSYYNQSQLGLRNDSGGLTVLTDTSINSTGFNQIFGPQVGLRFHRKTSRWTGIAECKFFAGINNQERRTSGILGSYLVDTGNVYGLRTGTGTGTGTGTTTGSTTTTGTGNVLENPYHQHGIYPFIPIGYTHNANSFGHKKFYRTFSPGVELQLNANWQLTKAVGLQVGFTSMYVHDVIRGAQVCDYTIHDDGSYFGVRSGNSVCSDVFVYGVTFGLVANRY